MGWFLSREPAFQAADVTGTFEPAGLCAEVFHDSERSISLPYRTLPTATVARLSSIATQAPEFRSDWRLR